MKIRSSYHRFINPFAAKPQRLIYMGALGSGTETPPPEEGGSEAVESPALSVARESLKQRVSVDQALFSKMGFKVEDGKVVRLEESERTKAQNGLYAEYKREWAKFFKRCPKDPDPKKYFTQVTDFHLQFANENAGYPEKAPETVVPEAVAGLAGTVVDLAASIPSVTAPSEASAGVAASPARARILVSRSAVKAERVTRPSLDAKTRATLDLVSRATFDSSIKARKEAIDRLYRNQLEDYREFKDGRDYRNPIYRVFQDDIDDARENSKPRRAFDAFRGAQDRLRLAQFKNYYASPPSRITQQNLRMAEEQNEKALADLGRAIESYHQDELALLELAIKAYQGKILTLLQRYPLPKEIRLTAKSGDYLYNNDTEMISKIMQAMRYPFTVDYLSVYFTPSTRQPFKNMSELRANLKPDQAKKFTQLTHGKKEAEILQGMNQCIYLNNAYRFTTDRTALGREFFSQEGMIGEYHKKMDQQKGYGRFEFPKA